MKPRTRLWLVVLPFPFLLIVGVGIYLQVNRTSRAPAKSNGHDDNSKVKSLKPIDASPGTRPGAGQNHLVETVNPKELLSRLGETIRSGADPDQWVELVLQIESEFLTLTAEDLSKMNVEIAALCRDVKVDVRLRTALLLLAVRTNVLKVDDLVVLASEASSDESYFLIIALACTLSSIPSLDDRDAERLHWIAAYFRDELESLYPDFDRRYYRRKTGKDLRRMFRGPPTDYIELMATDYFDASSHKIQDPRILRALTERLSQVSSEWVFVKVCWLIDRTAPSSLDMALALAGKTDRRRLVRKEVAHILMDNEEVPQALKALEGMLDVELAYSLEDPSNAARFVLLRVARLDQDRAAEILWRAYLKNEQKPERVARIMPYLAGLISSKVGILIERVVKEGAPESAAQAVEALGYKTPSNAPKALIEARVRVLELAKSHSSVSVRLAAVRSAPNVLGKGADAFLRSMARSDPDPSVRMLASQTLAEQASSEP